MIALNAYAVTMGNAVSVCQRGLPFLVLIIVTESSKSSTATAEPSRYTEIRLKGTLICTLRSVVVAPKGCQMRRVF